MMDTQTEFTHEEAVVLLPWLMNGSLSRDEQQRLSGHVESCIQCRREMREHDHIQAAAGKDAAAAVVPKLNVGRMMQRIEMFEERCAAEPWRRVFEFFRRRIYLATAAAAITVVALLTVVLQPQPQEPQFTTLTQTEGLATGNYVRTVFNPDLSAAQISQIVAETGLDIVSGPSIRGVYTLRVQRELSTAGMDELVRSLRERRQVLFAEPVIVGAPP